MKLVKIEQPDTDEEREIKSILAELQRSYQMEAKPYLDRLVQLQALRTPKLVLVPEEGDPAPPAHLNLPAIGNRRA